MQKNSTLAQSTRPVASSWHKDIFPAGRPASLVTPAPFHCQVRDGLEWFQRSKCTKKLLLTYSQVPEQLIPDSVIHQLQKKVDVVDYVSKVDA